jgi:PAS domain S-box-containing protein
LESKPLRRILILNEVGTTYPLINLVDQGIRTGLENSPYRIEFYREYMETVLFPDPADQQFFRDFYVRKYQHRRPDVIITVGSSPLRFMIETHRQSFPGVPVVFCYPNAPADDTVTFDPAFTGIEGDIAPAATVAAALRLLPNTLHVFVVGGIAPYDRRQQAVVKEQLKPYEQRLDITYLTELPIPSLLERLKRLPSHSIVLVTAVGKDTAGSTFTSNEVGPMVVAAANAPVFSLSDRHLNHGEIGGDISSAVEQGRLAAVMALRLLNGERPRDVPFQKESSVYMFDWRALKRWGLKEKNLPPGSIVLNREAGFWEAYKQYIIAGIFVFLAQAVAILELLWQRTRRRKVEAELRRSEEKFSKAFRQSPLAIIIISTKDGRYVDVNQTLEQETGWSRDEVLGKFASDVDFWADTSQKPTLIQELLAKGNVRDWEVPFRRKDGQIRTFLSSAELIEVNGEPCALLVVADITERKEAEKALSGVSRRLIEAQETERTRIGRELHDDINQRIAMVALTLSTLKGDLPDSEVETIRRIEDACADVLSLENDIQALSHRLHSSRLEYLGLEFAAAGFCGELSQQQNVEVDFSAEEIPESLPGDISLCLFRVLQEALHNAVKHSGVRKFAVSLKATSNKIQLLVHDSGAGFDAKTAYHGYGLGLTSMAERLRFVNGELSIESKSHQGTTIFASVPLDSTKVNGLSESSTRDGLDIMT